MVASFDRDLKYIKKSYDYNIIDFDSTVMKEKHITDTKVADFTRSISPDNMNIYHQNNDMTSS